MQHSSPVIRSSPPRPVIVEGVENGPYSYDETLISLFQRAKRSGVDWSQMFAVTDREGTGTVRERDFREAMVSIFCCC